MRSPTTDANKPLPEAPDFDRKTTIKEGEIFDGAPGIRQSYSGTDTRTFDRYSPYNERSCKSEGFGADLLNRKMRPMRSASLMESPGAGRAYSRTSYSRSPDSSLSESFASPDASCLGKYLTTGRYYKSQSVPDDSSTLKKSGGAATRRISRFLRPDFFDTPREESVYEKEKKEREMETQKVLKEIRDKRIKNRLVSRRDRSVSKEEDAGTTTIGSFVKDLLASQPETRCTKEILANVSENIKNLESKAQQEVQEPPPPPIVVGKKENVSKIARPKSYPSETDNKLSCAPEKTTKINKLKKGFVSSSKKTKESSPKEAAAAAAATPETGGEKKNKFLHSIEKKLEKLKAYSGGNQKAAAQEEEQQQQQKSINNVGNAIRKLREQSLPRTTETMITESGLIKRAVSVEDLSTMGTIDSGKTPLQASRKSVTKILGLFKKYEEKDANKTAKSKGGEKSTAKTQKNGEVREKSVPKTRKNKENEAAALENGNGDVKSSNGSAGLERPKSLLMDRVKKLQNVYNGAKTDPLVVSKLPRRSLNLDNAATNGNGTAVVEGENGNAEQRKTLLRLDFSKISSPEPLSPQDSDYSDCISPVSPTTACVFGPDENESVIDRIRRKSFYTRFNETKKPRKSTGVRDLDLKYADLIQQEPLSGHRSRHHHRSRGEDFCTIPEAQHKGGNKYPTYNPRFLRGESLDPAAMDGTTDEPKCFSFQNHRSMLCSGRTSISPSPNSLVNPSSSSSSSPHSISSPLLAKPTVI